MADIKVGCSGIKTDWGVQMRKRTFITIIAICFALFLSVNAWATTAETSVNEEGHEVTVVTDENGSQITIEMVGADIVGHEYTDLEPVFPEPTEDVENGDSSVSETGNSGSAGGTVVVVSGGTGAVTGGGTISSGSTGSSPTSAGNSTSGTQDGSELSEADNAESAVESIPEPSVPLTERVASALPESVQQALSTETDEQGNPVVSSRLVTLLLIIILVLLLIIVAGIVLVIVLVVTRRKNADKPGKRAGKHTAGVASAGHEEEETQETQPEE